MYGRTGLRQTHQLTKFCSSFQLLIWGAKDNHMNPADHATGKVVWQIHCHQATSSQSNTVYWYNKSISSRLMSRAEIQRYFRPNWM
jgi:hypothetical protein